MPLRSPNKNFFILGFQRLVWCPKWTPASNNSLIATTPMPSPPFKLAEHPCIGRGNRFPYSQAAQRIDADSDFIEWGRFPILPKTNPLSNPDRGRYHSPAEVSSCPQSF